MAVKGKFDDPFEPWDSRPAIMSDELPIHEVKIENLECDFNLDAEIMRPIFNAVWNVAIL